MKNFFLKFFILRATVKNKMYYTYLLESTLDKSWYIGYSKDLKSRFVSHNKEENIATKNERPWKLIYYEAYLNRIDAKKREMFLKSGSGRKYLKKQLQNYLYK
jgi:putative endonuclease